MTDRRSLLFGAAAALGVGRGSSSAAATGQADRMTVILDWLWNPNHAALFAAWRSGAFARRGLDVNLIAPSDPDSPSRLVAAGQADLAIGYGSQINMITAAGLPLLRVATLIDSPLNTVMALGNSGVRSLADLRGKRIGISVGGVEEAILDAMLRSAGVGAHDVTVVKVNYNMVSALISHRLDAATGAFRNNEVLQVEQLTRIKPVVFLPEQHGVPLYDELILMAHRNRRADPRLRRFMAGLAEGTATLLKDPAAMWRAFAAAHPELATPLNQTSWTVTMPHIARNPWTLDAKRYLAFQQFALAAGIVTRTLPLDQFAVDLSA
jgi:putative hydroxymethylpyrimidine transport system substrate-binding protein